MYVAKPFSVNGDFRKIERLLFRTTLQMNP
jgi:hypothetical protein